MAEYVSGLMTEFLIIDPNDDQGFRDALMQAPEKIHRRLMAEASDSVEKRQMGTTLTTAYIAWPWCYVLHVGDSQAFLIRDEQIRKITRDQTVAQSLLDGGMNSADIPVKFWHTLESCISASFDDPAPALYKLQLQLGDVLVLNSDGLTRHVETDELKATVLGRGSVSEKCEQLVTQANQNGGRDNITVVIADFATAPTSDDLCGESDRCSPSMLDTANLEDSGAQ